MSDESTGLYGKYDVRKDGERVEGCFVLRPDRDPAARVALLAYAAATENNALRVDLQRWVDEVLNAAIPDERAAMLRVVYEEAVAFRTRQSVLADRAAEEATFLLDDARRLLARLNEDWSRATSREHRPPPPTPRQEYIARPVPPTETPKACPYCRGSGKCPRRDPPGMHNPSPCPDCNGTGIDGGTP